MSGPAPARRLRRPGGLPGLASALAVLLLDQLSKHWAVAALADGRPRPLLPRLLDLRLGHNTGAAFSLFPGATPQLALVSGLVCLALTGVLLLRPPQRLGGA
ncbi:MAG: signal peptidase II, partial [Prochlorococcaceae cyanobacterium]